MVRQRAGRLILVPTSLHSPATSGGDQAATVGSSGHPLELFTWFRCWPRSLKRDLLYTFVWSTGFCVVISLLEVILVRRLNLQGLIRNFVISNCIGYAIHSEYLLAGPLVRERIRAANLTVRVLYHSFVSTSGVVLGYWLGFSILRLSTKRFFTDADTIFRIALVSLLVSGVLTVVYFWREREALAEAKFEREQARAARIEKEAIEANLRMLQAQIEPHFLFNTLANVVSLIDPAPAKAKRMLEDFIEYLRSSLRATRSESLTLRQEIGLIESYLRVIEVRMGNRLRYRFDIPDQALDLPFPPMLLQPLVENAVRHGLEPKVEGGEVTVSTRMVGTELHVAVADTGLGLLGPTVDGVGLSNVRERLASLYGAAARLEVGRNEPEGARVELVIPILALDAPAERR